MSSAGLKSEGGVRVRVRGERWELRGAVTGDG